MCESIFIPVLSPVVVLLPPLPPPPYLGVQDDAQTQWRIHANWSQWGLGLSHASETNINCSICQLYLVSFRLILLPVLWRQPKGC
jgi:hypothetical protein